MKRIQTLILSFVIILSACGGAGNKGNEKGTDKDTTTTDTTAKKKGHKHSHDHQGKIREDYSGVFKAGAPGEDLESFDTAKAKKAASLPAMMDGKDSLMVKLRGSVSEVCQKKGCWMKMDMGDDSKGLRVRFKDYSFFVPMNAGGSEAVVQGWAYRDTLSVEQLRHYAREAENKSKEEVEKITEPETQLAFKADKVTLWRGKEEKEVKGKKGS